jgi:hypothetical protein
MNMTDTQTAEATSPRKRQAIANASFDGAVARLKFHYPPETGTIVECSFRDLPTPMQERVGMLGIATAMQRSYTGIATSIPEAIEMAHKTLAALHDGTWEPTQKGDRESGPSDLVLAVERVVTAQSKNPKHAGFGAPVPTRKEVTAVVDGLSPAAKRSLRTDPEVTKALADIQMEKAREMKAAVKSKPGSTLLSGLFAGAKQAAE